MVSANGPSIVSCHAKDVTTIDQYPYRHITETYAGGESRLRHILDRTGQTGRRRALMIEHLNAEQLPKAVDYLWRKAEEAGVTFVTPRR